MSYPHRTGTRARATVHSFATISAAATATAAIHGTKHGGEGGLIGGRVDEVGW